MLENLKKIENPLTIIGMFCCIAEAAMAGTGTAVGIWGNPQIANFFIYFIVGFPVPVIAAMLRFIQLHGRPRRRLSGCGSRHP